MTHKAVITIKPGDVFFVAMTATTDPSGPADLRGYNLTCAVTEESGAHVANLQIVDVDGGGQNYSIKFDTQGWPLGKLLADIRVSNSSNPAGESRASESFVIHSVRGQTRRVDP